MAYEQKLKKIATNAWEVGGRKMRLMEIRQLAKDHGFKILTTTETIGRKNYTNDVFVVFVGGNTNDSAALLWKLGPTTTTPVLQLVAEAFSHFP